MNSKIRQQAERIYNQTRPDPRYVKMMGEASLTPVQRASLEEIEAHLLMVAEVADETGANLDPDRIQFGMTREQVVEKAEAKVRRWKRGAGARALKAKYGKSAAEDIIYKKTGKRINLQ